MPHSVQLIFLTQATISQEQNKMKDPEIPQTKKRLYPKIIRGSRCFPKGTKIYTPEGYKEIEKIKVKDKVYCFDKNLNIKVSEVEELFFHKDTDIINVYYENNKKIKTTANHPFLNQDHKFIPIGDFVEGDCVVDITGKKLKVKKIKKIKSKCDVYNFRVKKYNTYIAEDLLVHNKDGPPPCYPRPPPDPHTPREAVEGIDKDGTRSLSRTETETTDLISEGPIEGLVTGSYNFIGQAGNVGWNSYNFNLYASKNNTPYLRSVYWRNIPIIDDAGNFNYTQINFRYDNGNQVTANSLSSQIDGQISSNLIPQASRTLTVGDVLRYGPDFIKQYDFKSTNISQLIISLKIDGLYTQQNDPNVGKQEFDLGCGQRIKISQTVGDIDEREIKYNFKIYKITTGGLVLIENRNDRSYGKITSGFIDKFTFNLSNSNPDQDGFLGYRVRIERTSSESSRINLKDAVSVHAITEVFRENYVYPKTAVYKSLFTAEFFPDVPARSYDVKLLKVKIPSNYDPVKKTYNGDWNGNFSDVEHPSGVGLYWTDNPAWCYYDLLTNKRYGLGKYIPQANVDKWNLYQIAQYCDTIVEDGFGGLEPRFTCNAIISDFSDAFNLLNDFASIFRGMCYYANGSIYAISDSPREPFVLFTNSNVENGDFNYSSSSRKTRNTVAVIRYNDMVNFAKPTIEYVEDPEGVRKYGIRKVEITAFGCTSRGQAYRLGRWALASEQLETETVDFVGGLESLYLKPGDVVKIQDSNRILERLGGRVLAISTDAGGMHRFVLDEEYNHISGYFSNYFPNDSAYKFEILTPSFRVTGTNYSDFLTGYNKSEIQFGLFNLNNISGVTGYDPEKVLTQLTCNKVFDTTNYVLDVGATWTVQTTGSGNAYGLNAETELYRVIGINEVEPNKYNINALEYNPSKYDFIESGITISDSPTVNPVVVKEASYPVGMLLYTGSDKLYLNYRISSAADTGVTKETLYWKVYAKSGSDFSLGTDTNLEYVNINGTTVNVPKNEYLVDSLNITAPGIFISGNFIPTGNNTTYYFRVYGQNSRGYYSSNYSNGTFAFNSEYLDDYINLLSLNNLEYQTQQNPTSSVGLNLPSGNIFNDDNIIFNWEFENLATILKTWTNDDLTYRLDFGTGQFNYPTQTINNIIGTKYLNLQGSVGQNSASTGIETTEFVDILKDHTMSGFWLTVQAQRSGSVGKFTSQETIASALYSRSLGYLFGSFNNEPCVDRYDLDGASIVINANNYLEISLHESEPDFGSIYTFFTDQEARTGLLTNAGINDILKKQFVYPYPSFIDALSGSGIQLREAFNNGANSWSTTTPFFRTEGANAGTALKSGWMIFRPSTTFETALIQQYEPDFIYGTAYRTGYMHHGHYAYPPNSNGTPVAPVLVNYGTLPVGISNVYRFPDENDIGEHLHIDRNMANNLMYLKGLKNEDGSQLEPILVTTTSANLVDNSTLSGLLSGLSGYFQSEINSLSGSLISTGNNLQSGINSLSGSAFIKNQTNNGHLTLGSGYNINVLSGNLNLSGNASLGRDYNSIITVTGKFLRGIRSYNAPSGSSQAAATIITSDKVIVTGAVSNGSLALPSGLYGAEIEVRNRSTQTILIYPTGNDRIAESNGVISAINTPISINNSGNRNFIFGFSGANNIWFA